MKNHRDNLIKKDIKKKLVHLKKCEVCSSKKVESFITDGRIGSNYEYGNLPICICNECGYKFLSPRKNNQYYIEYYKKFYRSKKKTMFKLVKLMKNHKLIEEKKYLIFSKKK